MLSANVLPSVMLNIKKILLPVDIPIASLSVVHQAATLARHFNSEILMLHVATAQSHAAGVPEDISELAGWDLLGVIISGAQKQQDQSLSGRSLMALLFGAWWSKAIRLGRLCRWLRRRTPT